MKNFLIIFLGSIGIIFSSCSLLKNRVATPIFVPESGVYTNSVDVTVYCYTRDAIIYVKRVAYFYTNVNINTPPAVVVSDDWGEYFNPISLRTNLYIVTKVELSAYATKEDMDVSLTNTATYELRK